MHPWLRIAAVVATGIAAALAPAGTTAQSGGSFTIRKAAIAGGERASGGSYVLVGTVGQPAAGVSVGGGFVLQSGFHAADGPVSPSDDALFCSSFEEAPCS